MMHAEQQSRPTETSTLSDLGDDSSPNPKRMRLDTPPSCGTEDSPKKSSTVSHPVESKTPIGDSCTEKTSTRAQTMSNPTFLSSTDSGMENSTIFDLGSEDSANKSSTIPHPVETENPLKDSCIDKTSAPEESRSNPAFVSSEDSGIKNSTVFDVVNPMTSVLDLCSVKDASSVAERPRLEPTSVRTGNKDGCTKQKDGSSDIRVTESRATVTNNADGSFLMVCDVTVRKADSNVKLEMVWVEGPNRELMHQLMQFFKNRLI